MDTNQGSQRLRIPREPARCDRELDARHANGSPPVLLCPLDDRLARPDRLALARRLLPGRDPGLLLEALLLVRRALEVRPGADGVLGQLELARRLVGRNDEGGGTDRAAVARGVEQKVDSTIGTGGRAMSARVASARQRGAAATYVTANALSGSVRRVKAGTPARCIATAAAPAPARPIKPPFAPPVTVAR